MLKKQYLSPSTKPYGHILHSYLQFMNHFIPLNQPHSFYNSPISDNGTQPIKPFSQMSVFIFEILCQISYLHKRSEIFFKGKKWPKEN